MGGYWIKRLLQMIPVLFGVSVLVFLMIYLIPGNAAQVIAGPNATAEVVRNTEIKLGLDKPAYVQYLRYISHALRGDLGVSFVTGEPVLTAIRERFVNTLNLALFSIVLSAVVGLGWGILAACHPGSWIDRVSVMLATIGVSAPTFWIGIILMLAFCLRLRILPLSGYDATWSWEGIQHLILPGITLGLHSAAIVTRITRSSLLEVIGQDHIRATRAKGVSEWAVILCHALKNSLLPIVTVIGLNFGGLLSGAVVVEQVFAINGIGRLMLESISSRDFPMIQGCVLVISFTFVLVNLLVDLLYTVIDPRISYESKGA